MPIGKLTKELNIIDVVLEYEATDPDIIVKTYKHVSAMITAVTKAIDTIKIESSVKFYNDAFPTVDLRFEINTNIPDEELAATAHGVKLMLYEFSKINLPL